MSSSSPTRNSAAPPSDVSLDRRTWKRFIGAVRAVAASEVGGKFKLLFLALIVLMFGLNGLNVINSYVGRDFMTAIEQRNTSEFVTTAFLYVGVFAASTTVAVFFRFIEERLGLLWRAWLTRRLFKLYLDGDVYLHLKERGKILNPDQRIADDVRSFSTITLSFVLLLLNATFTILAFSSVMWSISPLLFLVAVGYAAAGSFLTITFGRPLVRLNYDQSDREASLRAQLVHVRENAESVALLQREGRLSARLDGRLEALIANMKRIIAVNRNLSFFTTGYNYGIQIIPALIIGPLFIGGSVEFGVITQSAMAFSHLLGAFSLVITQFQSVSTYAAVLARLSSLAVEVEESRMAAGASIESAVDETRLEYENLTLRSSPGGEVLVERLGAVVMPGTRVLVTGPDQARVALFRATAGLWAAGEGRIVRPPADRMMFLPERPYLPPGTLLEAVLHTGQETRVTEEEVIAVLRALDLEPVLARVGGLHVERDWGDLLSLSEQQLIAVARVRLAAPTFAVFQALRSTLGPEQVRSVVALLSGASIGCIEFGKVDTPVDAHDAVLELQEGGAWRWRPITASRR